MTEEKAPNFYEEFYKNYKTAESIASDRNGALSKDKDKVTKSRANLEKLIKTELNGGIPAETWESARLVQTTKDFEEFKRSYAFQMFAQKPSEIISKALKEHHKKALKNYLSIAPTELKDKKYEPILIRHETLHKIDTLFGKLAGQEDVEGKEKALLAFEEPIIKEMILRHEGRVPEQYAKLLKAIYATSQDNARVAMIQFARGSLKKAIESKLDEDERIKYADALLQARLPLGDNGEGIIDAARSLYEITTK